MYSVLSQDNSPVCVLYKLKFVTKIKMFSINVNKTSSAIPSLKSVSTGREEVRSHDIVSDKVVLNVIPLSLLLNTHSSVSPASVGGRLPVLNDMLTWSEYTTGIMASINVSMTYLVLN